MHPADDDHLNADQLQAMDSLWHAQRAGIAATAAQEAEELIRTGHTNTARRRLTAARRRARDAAGPSR